MTSDQSQPPEREQVPIGQLVLDAGLITPGDLERVLEEQRRTGQRLGELLVEGGYVAGRSIALALARQQGGLVETEYGFATPGTLGETSESRVPPVQKTAPVEAESVEQPPLRLAAEPEPEAAEPPEPVAVEVVPIYAEPAPEPAPEREPEPIVAEEPEEQPLEAEAEPEPVHEEAALPRVYAPDRHVLFIPNPSGYRIIERSGPCPEAGAMATLDFGRFLVNRVGPSPFPGERVACAFLETPPS